MNTKNQHIKLINKIYSLFNTPYICTNNWAVYLLSDNYQGDRPLITKAMVLLFTGLLDVVTSHRKKIDDFRNEAVSRNQLYLVRYCQQSYELVDSIIELWGALTEEEQIFIQDYRNQLVHGYLNGQNEDNIRVKCIKNGELYVKSMPEREYRLLISKIHERGLFGDVVLELVMRLMNNKYKYWKIWNEYSDKHTEIYENMLTGKESNWVSISA